MGMSVVQFTHQINSATGSGPDYNVMHVHMGTLDTAQANSINAAFKAWYTVFTRLYAAGVSITCGYKVETVNASPNVVLPVTPLTVNGTGTTPDAPQLSYVVSWISTLVGRSYRGRTYLGPIAQAANSAGGTCASSLVTDIQNSSATLISAIKAVDAADYLAVWSRKKLVDTPIQSGRCGALIMTQRRRR